MLRIPALSLVVLAFVVGVPLDTRAQDPVAVSRFIRGDANADGRYDVSDAVRALLCLFAGADCSSCVDAIDVDDDGETDIADPIALLGFLFSGDPRPPEPSVACGVDPTPDALDCVEHSACSGEDVVLTSRGPLEVVPVDHASLALLWNGMTIFSDPVVAEFSTLPSPDLVVVTHTHGDHMDANTLRAVVTANTTIVIPASVATSLESSGVLDTARGVVLANGESTSVGDVVVHAVPMYNLTPDRLRYHSPGVGNGYVLDLAGTRVYVSGDTEDIPEMRALENIDLAFVCMNLPFTMTPEQAASAVLEFRPRVVYPYHYRGQDPESFRALVQEAGAAVEVRVRDWYP